MDFKLIFYVLIMLSGWWLLYGRLLPSSHSTFSFLFSFSPRIKIKFYYNDVESQAPQVTQLVASSIYDTMRTFLSFLLIIISDISQSALVVSYMYVPIPPRKIMWNWFLFFLYFQLTFIKNIFLLPLFLYLHTVVWSSDYIE